MPFCRPGCRRRGPLASIFGLRQLEMACSIHFRRILSVFQCCQRLEERNSVFGQTLLLREYLGVFPVKTCWARTVWRFGKERQRRRESAELGIKSVAEMLKVVFVSVCSQIIKSIYPGINPGLIPGRQYQLSSVILGEMVNYNWTHQNIWASAFHRSCVEPSWLVDGNYMQATHTPHFPITALSTTLSVLHH